MRMMLAMLALRFAANLMGLAIRLGREKNVSKDAR